MAKTTMAEQMASFIVRADWHDISEEAREQLKIRVLDSLGCAIGALDGEPVRLIYAQLLDFGGSTRCTAIAGGRFAPDRVALYNGALVRYLDFNDSFLAKGETCHPSDNVAPVLAAAEYAKQDGRQFLTALAMAYQVQCRLSEIAPVRARGFDHTTQGSFAVAAGVSRALSLDAGKTANAIAICGTAFNALRVTRTGALSNWKGLAYPNTAFTCVHACFLAMRGITGPLEVFEGNKGFMDAIAGHFETDWSKENLEMVTRTILKKYNAEVHSQSTLEGVLELRDQHGFRPEDIANVTVETFDVAYHIIGGGEEGNKQIVRNKEEADHSLPYMVAVAMLDGQVMPEQYAPDRVSRADVQRLLRKVEIRASEEFSGRFPAEMPCRISIRLNNGQVLAKDKHDYEGFYTNPMSWDTVERKFERLSAPYTDASLRKDIVSAIKNLDSISVAELMRLLERVQGGQRQANY